MNRKTLSLLVVSLIAVAGCVPGGADAASEEQQLMQASRDWAKAAQQGNVDEVMRYFADDAVLFSEGRAPVRGREALRSYLAESYDIPGFTIGWEPLEAHVSGDLGYLFERTDVTMSGPDGAPVTQHLNAVTIWRKDSDGAWKNVVDVSVTGAPNTAP